MSKKNKKEEMLFVLPIDFRTFKGFKRSIEMLYQILEFIEETDSKIIPYPFKENQLLPDYEYRAGGMRGHFIGGSYIDEKTKVSSYDISPTLLEWKNSGKSFADYYKERLARFLEEQKEREAQNADN